MTDKEIRKLHRAELIDIIYQLQNSEMALQREVEDLKAQLEDRQIKINKAGSIAQAVVSLNDLAFHVQKTADEYLEEIIKIKNQAVIESEEMIKTAREQARQILLEAEMKSGLNTETEESSTDETEAKADAKNMEEAEVNNGEIADFTNGEDSKANTGE